jgi:16S rRNA (cytosine967-C5)-methyltransferase
LARLQQDWPADWPAIVAANNEQAPLWIRLTERADHAAFAEAMSAAGIDFSPAPHYPNAIRIDNALSPERLPGWQDGWVAVQDFSAQSAVTAIAVPAEAAVWDMCAAPGGKSAQLLETAPAYLLATDSEAARLQKVRDLLERLGYSDGVVDMQALDATLPLPEGVPQAFDVILLDAPCSATGIIRRQPDVKWHRTEKDIGVLNGLQWRLLKNAWRHLKPGGCVLYCTCSILKAENETLIQQFMAQHADAKALPLSSDLGRVSGVGRQRLPGEDGGDGFYYALLQKD